jgi:hypothetical protein
MNDVSIPLPCETNTLPARRVVARALRAHFGARRMQLRFHGAWLATDPVTGDEYAAVDHFTPDGEGSIRFEQIAWGDS